MVAGRWRGELRRLESSQANQDHDHILRTTMRDKNQAALHTSAQYEALERSENTPTYHE